ncbi:MerR family transcriptional regulator [Cryptosporangium sp. NPDC048952]|uniref:helix-turn-helix domain-containing protein n=1 Tax=Cryptosporangium sp. NPDC048952 TaxID=3363961 RepID=UPI0037117B1D
MTDRAELLTIGQLAQRTGLAVRTLRFWSDTEVVSPVSRSAGGYRLYDVDSVARVELVCTLRELGLGLDDVVRVLDGRATVTEIADAHVAALDARIRSLKVTRAVLSTVAKRRSRIEEIAVMNRLARLSATERLQIIDDFKREVFGDLDVEQGVREKIAELRIDLPEDPAPSQVDAWIELAELVQDPDFRTKMQFFLQISTSASGTAQPGARIFWARQVVDTVAHAEERGMLPEAPAAADLVTDMFGDADLSAVLTCLEAGIDAQAERYRSLVSRVRGEYGAPDATPQLDWLARAIREAQRR